MKQQPTQVLAHEDAKQYITDVYVFQFFRESV
jgi:hypothetical protein